MAASEARAAWQRIANRCFVQEDAKRAPKIACYSSSSSSKLHSESSYGEAENVPNNPATTFMPLNWNPSNSNLPPDTKWWLQLQPNVAYQKDFTHEHLDSIPELQGMRNGDVIPTYKYREGPLSSVDNYVDQEKSSDSLLKPHWSVSVTCMKHDSEARVQELKAVNSDTKPLLQHKADTSEYWYGDEELMDWESIDLLISNQPRKVCFDMEAPCMRGGMNEPWWRTADEDVLASIVTQKSLEYIENCDLPRCQTMNVHRASSACHASFNRDGILSSSLDKKCSGLCNPTEYAQCDPASWSMAGKNCPSSETHHLVHDSEKLCSGTNSSNTAIMDSTESRHTSDSDLSKAQLLEALCHSQTRAREAENAARQACTEKEHMIKLFFKQASHLFAYKQWLQVLQLEALLLQLKTKDHHTSMLFPVLPWMPLKARPLRKSVHKMNRRKMGKNKHHISKYAVAFAVGLSLVGAGLLLGWTLGWLLSSL